MCVNSLAGPQQAVPKQFRHQTPPQVALWEQVYGTAYRSVLMITEIMYVNLMHRILEDLCE